MKIAVIGNGYVGTTTAAILANSGHDVVGLDVDKSKVDTINNGRAPFYEFGLDRLVASAVEAGSLTATTDYESAIAGAQVVFSCVGTPDNPDGSSNLSYVESAVEQSLPYLANDAVYVQKSTVPVGTGAELSAKLPESVAYVSNPEFLRESTAIEDTLLFDRVVAGSEDKSAIETVFQLHRSIESNAINIAESAGLTELKPAIDSHNGDYISTGLESAELIKVSANAFLATKISFANSIAKLCDQTGADITEVMAAVGRDRRIGQAFLNAGRGYGGGCFPKDVSGLIASAIHHGVESPILTAVQDVNQSMPGYIINKAQQQLGSFDGQTIAVLGLAFKSGTSDTRKSAGIAIANQLAKLGANVAAHDPQANSEAKSELNSAITITDTIEDALDGVDVIFVATNWPEFETPLIALKDTVVVDCMNAYSSNQFNQSITYVGVGRNS